MDYDPGHLVFHMLGYRPRNFRLIPSRTHTCDAHPTVRINPFSEVNNAGGGLQSYINGVFQVPMFTPRLWPVFYGARLIWYLHQTRIII